MIIYLDNCCYNRPFDDLSQERIHLESEAILAILKRGQENIDTIIGSDILELEMDRIHDEVKRQKVKELYKVADKFIPYTEEIRSRAKVIMEQSKIRLFDSLHIASAEKAGAFTMLTTDARLIKMASKLSLNVEVMNPLRFVWEVFLNG